MGAVGAPPGLADWRLLPTLLVQRRRKRRHQVVLLIPPADYSGRVRLSVISGDERIEYSAAWAEAGHPVDLPPEEAADLQPWVREAHLILGRSLGRPRGVMAASAEQNTSGEQAASGKQAASGEQARSGQPAAAGESHPRWPLPFLVPQQPRSRSEADLILETHFEEDEPRHTATATLSFRPVYPLSRIYLVPILSARRAHDQESWDATLAAAVRQARHRREVRFAIDSPPAAAESRPEDPIRRLIAHGQVERVASGHPEDPPGRRVRIDLPATDFAILPPSFAGGLARPVAEEAALIAVESLAGRTRVIYRPRRFSTFNPLAEGRAPLAALFFQQALAEGLTLSHIGTGPRKLEPYHGVIIAHWDSASEWKALGKSVARWNRAYSSPEILLATPSDLLTALEELHALGRVQTKTL